MRHHGRAKDANGHVEHLGVPDDFKLRRKPAENLGDIRSGEDDFHQETPANREDERNDQRFDVAKSFVLKKHHDQHVERGDADAPGQRNFEQQIQRDG